MLAVVLQASEATSLTEMFLRCLLLQKMNMKLKFNLHSSEEFPQYLLSWALSVYHFPAMSSILFTVHAVVSHGMQKVLVSELSALPLVSIFFLL